MPDYNPAIAAQVQPPQAPAQPNFAQTLMQASEIQRNKASQALAEAQALQSQRKYNGLMAFSQSLAHNGDTNAAYQAGLAGGADPQDLKNGLDSYSQAKFMQGHGNQDPATALASANIARTGVETNNLAAQNAGIQAKNATDWASFYGNLGNTLANAPTDDNYKAAVAAAKANGHISPDRLKQLEAADTPEARQRWGKDLQLAAMPPDQAAKLQTYSGEQGVAPTGAMLGTSPPPGLGLSTGNPSQTTQTAPGTPAPQAGTMQPTQPGAGRAPMSPGDIEFNKQQAAKTIDYLQGEGHKAYANAQSFLGSMQTVDHAVEQLGPSWMGPGTELKTNIVNGINTGLNQFGINPIAPGAVANSELLGKEARRAGMQLISSQFGMSREAAQTIQTGIKSVVSQENSAAGARLLSEILKSASQRQIDLYEWQATHPNQLPATSEVQFNKDHPPQEYAMRGLANAIPPTEKQALLTHPNQAALFDKHYGTGMAQFIIGQQPKQQ